MLYVSPPLKNIRTVLHVADEEVGALNVSEVLLSHVIQALISNIQSTMQ